MSRGLFYLPSLFPGDPTAAQDAAPIAQVAENMRSISKVRILSGDTRRRYSNFIGKTSKV